MRNGRFLIIGGTVSEPYHSSNFFLTSSLKKYLFYN